MQYWYIINKLLSTYTKYYKYKNNSKCKKRGQLGNMMWTQQIPKILKLIFDFFFKGLYFYI